MNVWKKYNKLPEPKRFLVFFLGIAVPCLLVIPGVSEVLGYGMTVGQLVGLLVMTGIVLTKLYWE
jgi:hypothetical protein